MNAFQRCAVAGYLLGAALVAALGVPLWLVALLAATGAATFLTVVLGTRLLTGHEALVYQHHEIAVLATSAAAVALTGRPALPDLDAVALGLGVILAAGRVGCLRGGCCHGRPAAHGVRYSRAHLDGRFPPDLAGVPLFPVQLVEAALMVVIVGVGVALIRSGAEPGTALAWFITASAVERFGLEFLRGDPQRRRWRGVTEPQWLALALSATVALAGAGRAHTVVAACLGVACGVLVARPRTFLDDRDLAALAACLHAPPSGTPGLVALPSGGLVSAGSSGGWRHVTVSTSEGTPLAGRRARRLARVLARLHGRPARCVVVPGGGGTTHVLLGAADVRFRGRYGTGGSACMGADGGRVDRRARSSTRRSISNSVAASASESPEKHSRTAS